MGDMGQMQGSLSQTLTPDQMNGMGGSHMGGSQMGAMGSAMIFVWLQIPNVSKKYRTALIINGLVTGIATYHYFRIFNSWVDAFDVKINAANTGYDVKLSGQPFNDAYRYVDWLLTVPLLLIELVLVMGLSPEETSRKAWTLGAGSALMVALGYPD